MKFIWDLILYGPDTGNSSGGTSTNTTPIDPPDVEGDSAGQGASADDDEPANGSDDDSTTETTGKQFSEAFKRFLDKHGDPETAAEVLFRDNFQLRDGNRRLRDEIASLQSRTPQRGAMVLNQTEARTYKSLKELARDPVALKKELDEGRAAKQQLAQRAKTDTLREVADIVGYNFKVLNSTALANYDFVVKDVDGEGGAKIKQAFVKVQENGAVREVPLTGFVAANYDFLLPSLQVNGNGNGHGQGSRTFSDNGSAYGNGSGNYRTGQPAQPAGDRASFVRQPTAGTQRQPEAKPSAAVTGNYGTNIPGLKKVG